MADMKETEIDFTAVIPSHWKQPRMKFYCKILNGSDPKTENGEIPVYGSGSKIVKYCEEYKEGPVILLGRKGTLDKPKLITWNFWNVDTALDLHPYKTINLYYLFYTTQLLDIPKYATNTVKPSMTQTDYYNMRIPLPPLSEQQAIANFLDEKCSNIDNAVEKQKAIVEKLKEYRQSVITEAVTKGLDKDVEMKETGIEWLGEIPSSWEVLRIKNTSWLKGRIGWDGLKATEFVEEGPYLITGTDFEDGIINWNTCVHITKERYDEDELLHIKENDLLITKDGTVGKVAIVKDCPKEVSLNSGVLIIRNTSKPFYNSKYMYYVLLSDEFKHWFDYDQKPGSTIIHLYQHQFEDFKFTYPSLEEQQQIVDYLDNKRSKIDDAITRSNGIIEKLEEYKKSLIYEYVTGKKEVPSKYYEVQS